MVGDITNSNNGAQWAVASGAYETIDEKGIPYTFLPGNHDQKAGGSVSNRAAAIEFNVFRSSFSSNRFKAADYSTNINTVFSLDCYFAAAPGGVCDGKPNSIANNYKLVCSNLCVHILYPPASSNCFSVGRLQHWIAPTG